jgi:ABC-2 type transport system ATP-binding protein
LISASQLRYSVPRREILTGLDFELGPGRFLAVLGENGAGKTSLLDILMGFRRRTSGAVTVMGADPAADPWKSRARLAYLSEKIDLPGDWEAEEFLAFHRRFYPRFDAGLAGALMERFRIRGPERVGNLSAGEVRRIQIVGALAARPELLIADEITAVLDILGRRQFLSLLKDEQRRTGLTVVLATNVPEGLERYVDAVLLLSRGRQVFFGPLTGFLSGDGDLADAVARRLDSDARTLP